MELPAGDEFLAADYAGYATTIATSRFDGRLGLGEFPATRIWGHQRLRPPQRSMELSAGYQYVDDADPQWNGAVAARHAHRGLGFQQRANAHIRRQRSEWRPG